MLGFALAVVINRNPVASAMCLVATFISMGLLFVTLEAFFLAVVQVIVYAGAVMVLFLFIIMLLDIKAEGKREMPWFSMFAVLLLCLLMASFFPPVLSEMTLGNARLVWGEVTWTDSAREVGAQLFTRYLLPFMATAVLLLLATVGVVLLGRKGEASS